MKTLLLLCLTLGISSCAIILETDIVPGPIRHIAPVTTETWCPTNGEMIVSSVPGYEDFFRSWIGKLRKLDIRLSETEKMAAWSLVQMNVRPEVCSPTASLDIISLEEDKFKVWRFGPNEARYPFIAGVSALLYASHSPRNLLDLARLLDAHWPQGVPVSSELADFVEMRREGLLKNEIFKKIFFRADQPIRENELLPKIHFESIVRETLRKNGPLDHAGNTVPLLPLPLPAGREAKVFCNKDMAPYGKGILSILDSPAPVIVFGLDSGKGQAFMAVSSQEVPANPTPLMKTFLIAGKATNESWTYCLIERSAPKMRLALVSSHDRDPGQYLYQLFEEKIDLLATMKELDMRLKAPRKLLLTSPDRILIESSKMGRAQVDSLLRSPTPLFHKQDLGRIWGLLSTPGEKGFIIDERFPAGLSCPAP